MRSLFGLPTQMFGIMLIFFIFCAILFSAIWLDAPVKSNDSYGYMQLASDLQDFRLDALSDRTPGYPILLILSGAVVNPVRSLFYTQLLLHFISIYLGLLLLSRLKINLLGLYLFLILALLPPFSERAAYVLTENFTQFLLITGLVTLLLWLDGGGLYWLILSGFTLAFSGITRPTYQVLSVLCALVLVVLALTPAFRQKSKRLWLASGVLVAFAVLMIGGLVFYNAQNFGFSGLTPLSGFNLNGKTARFVERLPDEYAAVREVLIKHRDAGLIKPFSAHTGAGYIWEPETHADLQSVTGMNQVELSQYMLKLNLILIRSAPLEYLADVGRAFVTYWFPANSSMANMGSRTVQALWAVIHFGILLVFIGQGMLMVSFAVLFMNLSSAQRKSFSIFIPDGRLRASLFLFGYLVIFLTSAVSTVIQAGDARFRVPTDLIILMVTLLGLDTLTYIRRIFKERFPGFSVSGGG